MTSPSDLAINVDLHPKQAEVFAALCNPKNREVVVRKGRRAGGTFSVGLAATKFAIENPRSPFAPDLPTEIGFFGPIYENAFKIWREITDRFGAALVESRESKLDLVWQGGARGKCYSGEKLGAVLGSGLDIAEVDEASNFPGGLIRSHIVPALTDRQGRLWLVSSPRHGKLNHFAVRAMRAEAGEIPGVVGFHMSSYDNPRLSREWLDSVRNDPDMDDLTFREEWLAEILDSSSSWLDPSKILPVSTANIPANTFNTLHGDFAWADPEIGMVDRTTRRRKDANVLAVLSQDVQGNVYLRRDGFYQKYADQDTVFAEAGRLIRAYNVLRFCFEREVNVSTTTTDSIGRLWNLYREKHGIPVVGLLRPIRRPHWKTPQIRDWSTLVNRGRFFIEQDSVLEVPLRKEMMEYSETAAANDRCHDDVLVAVSDVKQPGIYQGRNEIEAAIQPFDVFGLKAAWEGAGKGNVPEPYMSKFSIV